MKNVLAREPLGAKPNMVWVAAARRMPVFTVLVALALALAVAGCKRHEQARSSGPALPTVSVQAQTVELKQHVSTEDTVGTVRSKTHAVIEAKIPGRIDQMLVVPGQTVKAGDLLTRLDAQEIHAKLDQALAVQQQAQSDLKRFQALLENSSATQAEFDAVQARARVAEGAVKEARTMLGYTRVVAPFDGVVTRKHADVGDLAAPGKPLLEMEDPTHLRLEADVPETIIGGVKFGGQLAVRASGVDGELQGTVTEIAPAADPNSRTFRVKLDLPMEAGLRAGQFGRVAVPVAETTALRVPATAVLRRGAMELIFVVANQHAELRLVKPGRRVGNEIEIASGLTAGEQIVTAPPMTMVDGQPLEIQP